MIAKLHNRYEVLNFLIRRQATGSPKELAQKLGISERAWYKIRDELVNDLGVPLAYCPIRRTYYYAEEGEIIFQFRRRLDTEQMRRLSGVLHTTMCWVNRPSNACKSASWRQTARLRGRVFDFKVQRFGDRKRAAGIGFLFVWRVTVDTRNA